MHRNASTVLKKLPTLDEVEQAICENRQEASLLRTLREALRRQETKRYASRKLAAIRESEVAR